MNMRETNLDYQKDKNTKNKTKQKRIVILHLPFIFYVMTQLYILKY